MTNLVIEGQSDTGAAKAVALAAGHAIGKIFVVGGTGQLDQRIAKYNRAAQHSTWIVFRDSDGACPVELRNTLTRNIAGPRSSRFSLRIAHTMIEAWLLADREGFSNYFHVSTGKIPLDPESEIHAKRSVLRLCSQSSSTTIRKEMVTESNEIGPLYGYHLNLFAAQHWNVHAASKVSNSLRRALNAIEKLAQ